MPRPINIEIWSDVVCPWCYLGKRRLENALARWEGEVTVHWRPFELNPGLPAEGVDRHAHLSRKFGGPEKLREANERLTELGRAEGVDYHFERITRTPNTFDAHRLICLAGQEGRQDAVVDALFRAYFERGEDVGRHDVLAGAAADAGMDADAVRAFLAGAGGRAEVRAEAERGRRLGINGVPFFVLDGQWALSGAQPPESFLSALRQVAAAE